MFGSGRRKMRRSLKLNELRAALELATDEELEQLTDILFRRKFNPLDYVLGGDPLEICSQSRTAWLDEIEARFRFVAADGLTVLRGKTHHFTYRQALIQVCKYLRMPYSQELSTTDLEAEIFLNLLGRAWKRLPESEQDSLTLRVKRSLVKSNLSERLPLALQKDPLRLAIEGSYALAVNSVLKPMLLKVFARQFALHLAKYQLAKQALMRGGTVAAAGLQTYVSAIVARRGMALSAARYGLARGALAIIGPALWGWFFADLGWRTIATNYGRIIPIIFTLAQIRLTRSESWEFA